ncbi:MAG: hypothetical protein NVSMB9_37050 [Isosphaeraceae bacterium]
MIAGPVAHFELVRIARRPGTFVLRFAFGMIVLAIIAANYWMHFNRTGIWDLRDELTLHELAQFGQSLFWSLMTAQAILILGLTPALVADAIASERQTRTLQDLLASRLNGLEIVLGKLTARLLNICVFLALVLPIMSLLTLVGGVSPKALFLGDASLASSTFFLAGLGLFASVMTRRPRDAYGLAYGLTLGWLFCPLFLEGALALAPEPWRELSHIVRDLSGWIWPASPLWLLTSAGQILGGGADELGRLTLWMVGSQVVHGTILIALSAWQLRPAFRRHEEQGGRRKTLEWHADRWFPVRPCGDDPVFWKEAYFSPMACVSRRAARLLLKILLVAAVAGALYGSRDAFLELWTNGFWVGDGVTSHQRRSFNIALRIGGTALFALWILWLGGLTASGISSEREQETWLGLLATPLDGAEILRGKMLGPLRSTAGFGVAILSLWLIGLAAGAVHPLGFLNATVVMATFVWFFTALGTYASLRSKTTWRARLWTQGLFIAPHVCCFLPVPSALVVMGFSLWSIPEIHDFFNGAWNFHWHQMLFILAYFFGGIVSYAVAAYFLTRASFRQFETRAGRPKRSMDAEVVLDQIGTGGSLPGKKEPGSDLD